MIVGNIENGLEHGFVEHCLNYVLIIDPISSYHGLAHNKGAGT